MAQTAGRSVDGLRDVRFELLALRLPSALSNLPLNYPVFLLERGIPLLYNRR